MDYWHECIIEAFDEAGIVATDEQIAFVAETVEGAHENYGLATGSECIPNPVREENKRLMRELERERNKQICRTCNGTGTLTAYGPAHSAISGCHKCGGSGFLF